jgi:hypothetical protein
VRIARERGLRDARFGKHRTALDPDERFDTILLLGNNVGLLGGAREGRTLLRQLARLACARGRLLGGSYDPYDGASEAARGYHARNRARGRLGGVERLRIRYRAYSTPWFDALFASREELASIVEGTGWAVRAFVDEGAGYVAVLDKARRTAGPHAIRSRPCPTASTSRATTRPTRSTHATRSHS